MFKKLLASLGMGSASVETLLHNPQVMPGGTLSGMVSLAGGDVEQSIDSLDVVLATHYERESNDTTYRENIELLRQPLTGRFVLAPRQRHEVPFSLQMPFETPITVGRQSVWLTTDLNISAGVDSTDRDAVSVSPHPDQQKVLDAMQSLGFQLFKTDAEYDRRYGRRFPFVQEWEFKPHGYNRARITEVELVFEFAPHGLEVLLEVDRRARGFGGWLDAMADMTERWTRVTLPPNADTRGIAASLDNAIQRAAR